MTARSIGLYEHTTHDERLIVTTAARFFSPLTAKCDRFCCQTTCNILIRYGMHFSAIPIGPTTPWQRASVVRLYRLQLFYLAAVLMAESCMAVR